MLFTRALGRRTHIQTAWTTWATMNAMNAITLNTINAIIHALNGFRFDARLVYLGEENDKCVAIYDDATRRYHAVDISDAQALVESLKACDDDAYSIWCASTTAVEIHPDSIDHATEAWDLHDSLLRLALDVADVESLADYHHDALEGMCLEAGRAGDLAHVAAIRRAMDLDYDAMVEVLTIKRDYFAELALIDLGDDGDDD